ncbi:MAG: proline--tRNA ligase [Chloroflexi bacterium]|nr:proline--tRNA ligase [Chloroflexota bacterium]MYJ92615.1 proline--tRNA ligase [Chloroflexota bacterium]
MPVTRMSGLFGRTLREAPADADSANHQLLLRSGLIVQLAAGVYSFLPPAWTTLLKIEQIIREEMQAAGSQEMRMPAIQPRELWEESGRADSYGPVLFNLKDRRDRTMVLAPTHEESVTDLFRKVVQSYRDLPQSVFQMQTKFRDEPRPRGGLVRVREFIMKDAYTFDVDDDAFQRTYNAMRQAYYNIFERCGVPVVAVQADSGAIGGKQSEEFIFLTEIGEDNIILCSCCGYAANQERAEFRRDQAAGTAGELEEVETPGVTTIDGLASFLDIPAQSTAKAAFFLVDGQPTFAVIRGDLEVNELKLINALDALEARPLLPEEVEAAGWVAGYASPIGVDPARVIADPSVVDAGGLVAGANRVGMHARNVTYGRDWTAATVADIGMAQPGDTCTECDDALEMKRGIELGHIFKLGTRYAEPMEATFLDSDGERRTPIMGCYGIGVERLMAAVVQANHDEMGIVWPPAVAPYDVHVVPLGGGDDVASAVADVESALSGAGLNVLVDDREERAGVKFNDADLLGAPLRITIGSRGLKQGQVELKLRRDADSSFVPLGEAASSARDALASIDRSSDLIAT